MRKHQVVARTKENARQNVFEKWNERLNRRNVLVSWSEMTDDEFVFSQIVIVIEWMCLRIGWAQCNATGICHRHIAWPIVVNGRRTSCEMVKQSTNRMLTNWLAVECESQFLFQQTNFFLFFVFLFNLNIILCLNYFSIPMQF